MRSLIKIRIEYTDADNVKLDWNKDSDYSAIITKLFDELGYKNISSNEQVWKAVPEDISSEEKPRVVYSGYTSSGQAHFSVTAILHDVIHVRCAAETFFRISKACEEINRRVLRHAKKYKGGSPTGKINPNIYVLEHGQSVPTINGIIINNPIKSCYKNTSVNCFLLLVSIVLIISSYNALPIEWFKSVFSALTVMAITNFMPIIIEYRRITAITPIHWDNKIVVED